MGDWIGGIIAAVAGGIGSVASAAARAVSGFWNVATGFWGNTGRVIDSWRVGTRQWLLAWQRYVAAQLLTLRWIIAVAVPGQLAALAISLRAWVAEQLAHWTVVFTAAILSVRLQLAALAIAVYGAVARAVAGLWAAVNDMIARVVRLERLSLRILDTPEHLAAWLLGAMVDALLRYIESNAEPILRRLYRARVKILLESADFIESLIVRII